jgi:hypothetical protein
MSRLHPNAATLPAPAAAVASLPTVLPALPQIRSAMRGRETHAQRGWWLSLLRVVGFLLAWLIVATVAAAASGDGHADAVNIFQCAFGEEWDVNYDAWPDRWVRQTGPAYPHYVDVEIRDEPGAEGGKCLAIDLDGAAAAVNTPPIRVMSRFSYLLMARLKADGLQHSTVVLSIDFFDKSGHRLQSIRSEPYGNTDDWQAIHIGPVDLEQQSIDRAVIGITVARGGKGDLQGHVLVSDVRLARLPRITVSSNSPFNVYFDPQDVVITCELSGIRDRDPEIRFHLLDACGNELQAASSRLDGRLIVEDSRQEQDVIDGTGGAPAGYEGTAQWRPTIPECGFYRVVVNMLSAEVAADQPDVERELDNRTVWLAVAPPLPMPTQGEFGWTLPQGDQPLSLQQLSRLLPQLGMNWVKVPLWYDPNDPRRGDEIIRFVELLAASNVEVVGIIDRPPAESELGRHTDRDIPIADLLTSDASSWQPSLDPVMTRLSLRVRWWQLGRDYDTSFVGLADLVKRIDDLRAKLYRFGQDVKLGLCWGWDSVHNVGGNVSWDFQQLSTESPPSTDAFNHYLSQPPVNSALRWVLVEPPPPRDDPSRSPKDNLEARIGEFVRKLVVAKEHGADAIFIPDPFNDQNGLMRANGMPGELLLSWRATAAMLSGARYLGQIELPGGSDNRVFRREDGQVVMVVWNSVPTREVLYLGKNVHHVDVWGRTAKPAEEDHQQVIEVSSLPSFVVGLHDGITQWRIATRFDQDEVPSVFAAPHPNALHFRNFFPQGVGGSLEIKVLQHAAEGEATTGPDQSSEPQGFELEPWSIDPPKGTFRLAAGEDAQLPFQIKLKNALFGPQPVRVDFQVEADELYRFSVYHTMRVGTGDISIEVDSHLDQDGTLVVEQFMTNRGPRLADFKCSLYAKGYRLQRTQVYRLGEETDRKVYRYPAGASLVGRTLLLEIEEVNGQRVFRCRFVATAESNRKDPDQPQQSGDGGTAGTPATGVGDSTDLGHRTIRPDESAAG